MKRIVLSLLLATASASALAAPVDCSARPRVDPDALTRAEAALEKAKAQPGTHGLALAEALADMAGARSRYVGKTPVPKDSSTALDLIARAQAIWAAAPGDAELATRLWKRGRRDLLDQHCPLALAELQSALAIADRSGAAAGPLALSIARDLAGAAAALGDDPTLNAAAPRLLAALEGDTAPLAQDRLDAYLAVAGYYYRTQENARAEQALRRLLDKARLANPEDAALQRRLHYELASVLYAQLRYKEAESLIAPLARPGGGGPADYEAHKRLETDMAARVRGGDLAGATTLGREALAHYASERERVDAALAEALAAEQAAVAANRHAELPAAKTRVAQAREELNVLVTRIADIQGNLGEVLHARGQLDEALDLYEKALGGYRSPDATHLHAVNRVRAAMGILYRTRGDYTRALALQQQVQAALLPYLGKAHPDVVEVESEVAALKLTMQQPDKPAPARPAKRRK